MQVEFETRILDDHGHGTIIRIVDPTRPLVMTFDNLFTATPDMGRKGWGDDWCAKNGVNFVGFLESEGTRYYGHPAFPELVSRVNHELSRWDLARRINYGASMGGYAALAHAELCKADTVLAINPICSGNKDSDAWKEDRFLGTRPAGWVAPWTEAAFTNLQKRRVMTLFDPFQEIDRLHAALIPGEKYLVPFLGHALERYAAPIGLISLAFAIALKPATSNDDRKEFRQAARARRRLERYYTLMSASYNPHLTPRRAAVVLAHAAMNCAGAPPTVEGVDALRRDALKWVPRQLFLEAAGLLRNSPEPAARDVARLIEAAL